MEQRTSTGNKRTQLPVSLYPLPKSPAAVRFQTGYDGPPAAAKAIALPFPPDNKSIQPSTSTGKSGLPT